MKEIVRKYLDYEAEQKNEISVSDWDCNLEDMGTLQVLQRYWDHLGASEVVLLNKAELFRG
ncbi:hypothetical protein E2542_SST15899 [Spatholobus suberectus]|nr:hypothetical protein E2542_SST15899 [Spatholobus suberectus]